MSICSTSRLLALAGAALGLVACSSPPPNSLIQARGEVGDAAKAPPATYSQADLNQARLKLSQADNAARNDDMHAADLLAQESLADLRLARSRATAEQAAQAEKDMQNTISTLQSEATQPPAAPTSSTPQPTR